MTRRGGRPFGVSALSVCFAMGSYPVVAPRSPSRAICSTRPVGDPFDDRRRFGLPPGSHWTLVFPDEHGASLDDLERYLTQA